MQSDVIHDVVVPDYDAGSLSLSHLVLASRGAAQAMTTRPDPVLKDRLSFPPTAIRTFDRRDVLTVLAEAYDNVATRNEAIQLVTTVSDQTGSVVFRSVETVEASNANHSRRSWTHRVDVPLRELAAGTLCAPRRGQIGAGPKLFSFARGDLLSGRPRGNEP